MGAQISELLADVVTRVERTFETANGEMELKLAVRHKRITTDMQLKLQAIAEQEMKKLTESLDKRRELIEKAKKEGKGFNPDEFPIYSPRSIPCLQLELLVLDLDIFDDKKKPVKPTYENLIALPVALIDAIREEIDSSVLPKKKTSMTSRNGTQAEESEEPDPVG